MELTVRTKVNTRTEITTSFEGDDIGELIKKASIFLQFDGKCAFCSGEEMSLISTESGDGFKFVYYECTGCKATRNFGKHKTGDSYFLKPWKEAYVNQEAQ